MDNIFENAISFTSFQEEDDAPQVKDKWARKNVLKNRHELDQLGAEVRDIKEFLLSKLVKNRTIYEWKVQPFQSSHPSNAIDIPSSLRTTFEKLEEDFDSISRRIVWCDELKEYLLSFEDELEDHNVKYLSWFVSTLRDIFAYNYAEQLTYKQLMVLKEGLEIIYEKNIRCDKEAFEEYYSMLVVSGLSLLPTSSKAINEFGE